MVQSPRYCCGERGNSESNLAPSSSCGFPEYLLKKIARSKIMFRKKFLCTIYSQEIHRNWKYSWGDDHSEMSGLLKIVQCRHCSQSILNFQPRCRRKVAQSNPYKLHFHNYKPVSNSYTTYFKNLNSSVSHVNTILPFCVRFHWFIKVVLWCNHPELRMNCK